MYAIEYAWERGVRNFDTAGSYGLGLSEERLGETLGLRIRDANVCTKGGIKWLRSKNERAHIYVDNSLSSLKEDVLSSLERLRLDILPCFLVHRVLDTSQLKEIVSALEELKESKLIRSFGLSNVTNIPVIGQLKQSIGTVAQFSFSLLDLDSNDDVLEYYSEVGIKTMTFGGLAQGLLSGKYVDMNIREKTDRRSRLSHFQPLFISSLEPIFDALKEESEKTGFSLAQIALAILLEDKRISYVVIGCKNQQQIKEALDVAQDSVKRSLISVNVINHQVQQWKTNFKFQND